MSNEEINELFYTLQREFASRVTQRTTTWEEIIERQLQALVSQQEYNFKGANYLNNNAGYFSQPQNIMSSYNYSKVGGHMTISPMDIQVNEVNKTQVPIIKNNSSNHLLRSSILP